jgi:hypothetical protein
MVGFRSRYLLLVAFHLPSRKDRQDSRYLHRTVKAAHSRIAWFWLHAGCKIFRFRGFRRLAAVQTAKTMQALAARTTSSHSCTARFFPECHHSLRQSDTIDPRHASIRVSSCAIVSSWSAIFFRVPVFLILRNAIRTTFFGLDLPIYATSDKHRSLTYVHIDVASMP